jgi:hypothetical protein
MLDSFLLKGILYNWLYPGGTMVEHSTLKPKTVGSNPAPGTGREKVTKT